MNDDRAILARATELSAQGRRFALVTVVGTKGSTPRKAGAKMIVCEGGELLGTIGGGRLEHELVEEARAALASGEPRLVRHHLTHELAMCCGGEVEAFIDLMGRKEVLVLVGAGHISAALAPLGVALGFEIIVADEREELASAERFPASARLVHAWEPEAWNVALGGDTSIVVATHDHAVDQAVLEQLARSDARPAYVGVIGSRGKLGRFRRRLQAKGIADAWIEQVRGPIGLDIGAETPEEIAVAVAAELVAIRRRHVKDETE